MNWLRLNRQCDRPTRRRQGRRPLLEDLEGRQLLSGIVGNHIGTSVAAIQGAHIGTSVAAIQGAHVGSAMIVGNHIGM
jgi:hypothetical protein